MHIYVKELTLDKANIISSCRFLNLDILTRVYDKRDDFSFPIVNFLFFWMMTFPSYGLYISHLVRFPRICNNVFDINDRNLIITEKLLHQGYHFHQLLKTFTNCVTAMLILHINIIIHAEIWSKRIFTIKKYDL